MNQSINCPNCGFHIDIEEILKHQMEEQLQAEFQKKIQSELSKMNAEKERIQKEKMDLDKLKESEHERLKLKLEEERRKIAEAEEKKAKDASANLLNQINEKLQKSEVEILTLRQKELELKNNEERLKQQYEFEMKKKLFEEQQSIENKVRQEEQEKIKLQQMEWEKKLKDQMNLVEEMQRKAQQGSMQLQGEVLELAIEEMLKKTFPFDEIIEVQKGVRGADIIQKVRNNQLKECGSIIYETKRTENWSNDWIEKLKKDKLASHADIAILITQAFPKNYNGFAYIDGVWVCSYKEVESVAKAMRMQLIQFAEISKTQENKGDKSMLLYDFLTSQEFRNAMEAIIDSFSKMKDDLEREKNAMLKHWKSRELQIERVRDHSINLYASIKNIGGNELIHNAKLELGEGDDEDTF